METLTPLGSPRGNGVMGSTIACYARGQGSILAVGSKLFLKWFFLPLGYRSQEKTKNWTQTH